MIENLAKALDEKYGYGNWKLKRVSRMKRHGYPSLNVLLRPLNVYPGEYVIVTVEENKVLIQKDRKVELPPGTYKLRKVSRNKVSGYPTITLSVDLANAGINPKDYVIVVYQEDKVIIEKL